MRYSKKFIKFGGSNAVIIPIAWIRALERKYNKRVVGAHLDTNDTGITITPMWEET